MTNLENLELAVEGILAKQKLPTPDWIREVIGQFRVIPTCSVTDDEAERLARRFEERHSVSMTIGAVLHERDYVPWLDQAKSLIEPYYWERYRKLLTGNGFASQVLSTTDDVTDRILGLIENPVKDGPWDRRGMVVGHVQSGKTANYTGLICKAADAGYRLIVVIAGVHNNLRNQTQLRIDEGFVGRDSAKLLAKAGDTFVGVGRFDSTRRPATFTNSVKDFNKTSATGVGVALQTLTEPAVFVIKKNASTLTNLLDWLRENSATASGRVDIPVLVIDDEADNASINVRGGPGAATRINGQIRQLLNMFQRSCYVGYTATPFANIFVDPDTDDDMFKHDLFPRHFIISLDPPSNYFGAHQVFLADEGSRAVRHITDHDATLPLNHKISAQITDLPDSLIMALRMFVLARAIRLARGHGNPHCSMLVNVSRFTAVQGQVRYQLHERLERIKASIRVHGAKPSADALQDVEIAGLHAAWLDEYREAFPDWEALKQALHLAASPIRVVEVNSNSADTLNYNHNPDGLNVIAVGGYSLSRGLTLEGLAVSYFLRNSRMYDTLMQMARWFGYRPGYEDLCRVWMLEEAEGWYAHIAESIEMLREELREMEAAGSTPEEFGLKVRSHPDNLLVTARNKMGSAQQVVVNIGLDNAFIETATLRRDPESLARNLQAVRRLGQDLYAAGHALAGAESIIGGWLLRDVPADPVIDFVGSFRNHPDSAVTDPVPVRRYIELRRESELGRWDVLFASLQSSDGTITDSGLGVPIHCQKRTPGDRLDASTLRITNKQRVASRGVEKTGVSTEKIAAAEAAYAENADKAAGTLNFPDRIYRRVRDRPLLIVHLLSVEPAERGPVVAYSISFPKTDLEDVRVAYVVNTTWLRENEYADVGDDDLDADDA